MVGFVPNCKCTEAQINSIYFLFNQSRFSLEQGCTLLQNSVLSLDFDTVIFYRTHAMFNNLVSALLQGELTQSLQQELVPQKHLELSDTETVA